MQTAAAVGYSHAVVWPPCGRTSTRAMRRQHDKATSNHYTHKCHSAFTLPVYLCVCMCWWLPISDRSDHHSHIHCLSPPLLPSNHIIIGIEQKLWIVIVSTKRILYLWKRSSSAAAAVVNTRKRAENKRNLIICLLIFIDERVASTHFGKMFKINVDGRQKLIGLRWNDFHPFSVHPKNDIESDATRMLWTWREEMKLNS